MRLIGCLLLACVVSGCGGMGPPQGQTPYEPSAAMRSVLAEHQAMRAVPPSGMSPDRAREVPTLVDAARALPNVRGLPADQTEVPQVQDLVASGAAGPLAARLYRPARAKDTPTIVFFPGGTWVTGSLDSADESARQLSARTGWVVVAIRTRLAPEARFPAAHDDALAAFQWARGQMRGWGADPTRVALAGEGAGANLALSTALAARDRGIPEPDHLLLITPLVGTSLDGPSMTENARSRPLTRGTVRWAQSLYAPDRGQRHDPRLDLLGRPDLDRLPAATVVLAEIDPLRSEGQALVERLAAAGPLTPGAPGVGMAAPVRTEGRLFQGTAHGFFGLGDTVPEAAVAEEYAATRLKAAFYRPALPVLARPAARPVRHRRAVRS
jgi:acetyl esterase/lipase